VFMDTLIRCNWQASFDLSIMMSELLIYSNKSVFECRPASL
jgi:hypothetical protein